MTRRVILVGKDLTHVSLAGADLAGTNPEVTAAPAGVRLGGTDGLSVARRAACAVKGAVT